MKYRLKFVLADGRMVYASTRGNIEEKTEEELAQLNLDFISSEMGYSPDLSLFSSLGSLRRLGITPVAIRRVELEECDLPVDETAFTQNRKIR